MTNLAFQSPLSFRPGSASSSHVLSRCTAPGGRIAAGGRVVRTKARVAMVQQTPGLSSDLTFRADAVSVEEEISNIVDNNALVLFMKGTSTQPQCGFSRTTLMILQDIGGQHNVKCVNCLDSMANPGLREGIKSFSRWPTIPQLYINGEFIGGCDIVMEMAGTGQLHEKVEVALAS